MTTVQSNITRRDFLKFTAKTTVMSSGFLAGCSTTSASRSSLSSAIDIHHHYIPLELIEEVKAHGKALGVEYFPPKDAKDNSFQIQFPKGSRFRPDPRMTEINNRLEVMTKETSALPVWKCTSLVSGTSLTAVAAKPGRTSTTKQS